MRITEKPIFQQPLHYERSATARQPRLLLDYRLVGLILPQSAREGRKEACYPQRVQLGTIRADRSLPGQNMNFGKITR